LRGLRSGCHLARSRSEDFLAKDQPLA
jgi:hypothetical protein